MITSAGTVGTSTLQRCTWVQHLLDPIRPNPQIQWAISTQKTVLLSDPTWPDPYCGTNYQLYGNQQPVV